MGLRGRFVDEGGVGGGIRGLETLDGLDVASVTHQGGEFPESRELVHVLSLLGCRHDFVAAETGGALGAGAGVLGMLALDFGGGAEQKQNVLDPRMGACGRTGKELPCRRAH